jgi:hypothetical protein
MPLVDAWMGNVIAVAGTLLGSVAGYVFQRLNAGRTERFARDERLRQERMAAYSGYAGAVTDLRRAVVSLWFLLQRTDSGDAERRAAYTDADRFGAAAAASRFRVQLLADDHRLVELAATAAEPIDSIRDAADAAELGEHEVRCEEGLREFIAAAGAQLR